MEFIGTFFFQYIQLKTDQLLGKEHRMMLATNQL